MAETSDDAVKPECVAFERLRIENALKRVSAR